jgi:hypothetical protein
MIWRLLFLRVVFMHEVFAQFTRSIHTVYLPTGLSDIRVSKWFERLPLPRNLYSGISEEAAAACKGFKFTDGQRLAFFERFFCSGLTQIEPANMSANGSLQARIAPPSNDPPPRQSKYDPAGLQTLWPSELGQFRVGALLLSESEG